MLHAATQSLPEFRDLVRANSPAVVNIATVSAARQGGANELWRFFEGERRSLGSGFILTEDGYVLTNHHVVADADQVFVRLVDRRELEATVVGTDERSDLVLLKVDAADLPVVSIGDSSSLEVGEWVLAIGSPFGFDYSVTAGIVSAKGRSLPRNNGSYVPFIQTDTAINPGNSGGPLFNLAGEVIGINSQIISRTGGFQGVAFAIPIDIAMEVVDQLKNSGIVKRGWLGVGIQEVDNALAQSFGLARPQGALIRTIDPDGPAQSAGIAAGDVVTLFDGHVIDRSHDLPHRVGRTRPGAEVEVSLVRSGEPVKLVVVVGELPENPQVTATGAETAEDASTRLGLVVESLDAIELDRIDAAAGVRVTSVEGPAFDAGIRRGDVIVSLNHHDVTNIDSFDAVVGDLQPGKHVPVLVLRGRNRQFYALRVPG